MKKQYKCISEGVLNTRAGCVGFSESQRRMIDFILNIEPNEFVLSLRKQGWCSTKQEQILEEIVEFLSEAALVGKEMACTDSWAITHGY